MNKVSNAYWFKHKDMTCYAIWEPIFHAKWVFAFCCKFEDFKGMVKKCYDEDLEMPRGYVSGRCSTHVRENGDFLNFIWLSKFNYPELAHEITHGIVVLFDFKRIEINIHSDEFFAYYLQFIMAQLEKVKSKKRGKG